MSELISGEKGVLSLIVPASAGWTVTWYTRDDGDLFFFPPETVIAWEVVCNPNGVHPDHSNVNGDPNPVTMSGVAPGACQYVITDPTGTCWICEKDAWAADWDEARRRLCDEPPE